VITAPLVGTTVTDVAASSGNVFADLGVPDADERLTKALLSRIIQDRVRDLRLTQRAAASLLGIATSDMSDLMRGKLARFGQERIIRLINALDLDVVIQVSARQPGKEKAGVEVHCVSKRTREAT
jgi:predicted XRE-type DNA-binding protein